MMTSDDFNRLNYTEKLEISLRATFLAERLTEHFYVKLYNLNNFYVEVFYDDCTHIIASFRAFEHTLFVMPYLEDVSVAV